MKILLPNSCQCGHCYSTWHPYGPVSLSLIHPPVSCLALPHASPTFPFTAVLSVPLHAIPKLPHTVPLTTSTPPALSLIQKWRLPRPKPHSLLRISLKCPLVYLRLRPRHTASHNVVLPIRSQLSQLIITVITLIISPNIVSCRGFHIQITIIFTIITTTIIILIIVTTNTYISIIGSSQKIQIIIITMKLLSRKYNPHAIVSFHHNTVRLVPPLIALTRAALTFTPTISTVVFFHHQCQLLSCLRLLLVYLLVP